MRMARRSISSWGRLRCRSLTNQYRVLREFGEFGHQLKNHEILCFQKLLERAWVAARLDESILVRPFSGA